jgi:DNA repair exonuclease SbcCD nuclease subunit
MGRPPVIYAGSVERTSFAEAPEVKGFVVLQLTRSGLGPFEFRPLPARPMVALTLSFANGQAEAVEARVSAAIRSTPDDAVVQLRVAGALPEALNAAMLRRVGGSRTVTLAIRADRRGTREASQPGTESEKPSGPGREAQRTLWSSRADALGQENGPEKRV